MTFGEKLKHARKQKGFTQLELSKKLGIASTTLAGYESGNREPDVFKIKKIIEILELDSNYLFGIESNTKTKTVELPFSLTPKYKKVITAYVDQPEMQPAVDRILGLTDEEEKVITYRAARSADNHPAENIEISKKKLDELFSLPTVESDEDL